MGLRVPSLQMQQVQEGPGSLHSTWQGTGCSLQALHPRGQAIRAVATALLDSSYPSLRCVIFLFQVRHGPQVNSDDRTPLTLRRVPDMKMFRTEEMGDPPDPSLNCPEHWALSAQQGRPAGGQPGFAAGETQPAGAVSRLIRELRPREPLPPLRV